MFLEVMGREGGYNGPCEIFEILLDLFTQFSWVLIYCDCPLYQGVVLGVFLYVSDILIFSGKNGTMKGILNTDEIFDKFRNAGRKRKRFAGF